MSTPPKTTAQMYEELTDEQVIERLAKDVMGWSPELPRSIFQKWIETKPEGSVVHSYTWNPLRYWDSWRMVEEKVFRYEHGKGWENEELEKAFSAYFCVHEPLCGLVDYVHADLPTRCRAVLAAWDSLNAR